MFLVVEWKEDGNGKALVTECVDEKDVKMTLERIANETGIGNMLENVEIYEVKQSLKPTDLGI